jgi:hypothetical protein
VETSVRPSLTEDADVEAVSVAPAQPNDDTSSAIIQHVSNPIMCANALILKSLHIMLIKDSWPFNCCLICPTMVLNSGFHMNYEQEQMEDNDN